jgi:hypothetical protein
LRRSGSSLRGSRSRCARTRLLLTSPAGAAGVLRDVVDKFPLGVELAFAVSLDAFLLHFAGNAGDASANGLSRSSGLLARAGLTNTDRLPRGLES